MIGLLVPSVFAGTIDDVETVSNNIGSATLDKDLHHRDQPGYCKIIVYGFINIRNIYNDTGQIIVTSPAGSIPPNSFLPRQDGSFTDATQFVDCKESGVYKVFVSYGGVSIGTLQFFIHDYEQSVKNEKAAEQRAAEQRAAEQRAAEQRAAEQRAAEQRAAEQRAAEQRAAEAKADQDLTNLLIIGGIVIIIISVAIVLAKRKNKKSSAPQRSATNTSPPPTPPTNTETSTMFFYECPKCQSADIQNNTDGSVNCPDCGYRG
jgi:pyruvate/2-oxoglutarate dehydrogenase complex dihydrolipoamide acyltransferase (E2) component